MAKEIRCGKNMVQLQTHFKELYFELKEDNELNKKHVGLVMDETTFQPHDEEAHVDDTLKNLTNAVK